MQNEADKFSSIKKPIRFLIQSLFQMLRFTLVAIFSFPVALLYIISALILDPSIPESAKHRLPELVIDQFEKVFQYSVTLAILLSLAVMFTLFLTRARDRIDFAHNHVDSNALCIERRGTRAT